MDLSYRDFKINWAAAMRNLSFRRQLILTLVFLALIAFNIAGFFNYIQLRPGYVLNDFVLNSVTPRDVSLYTFLSVYAVIVLSIVVIGSYPVQFLKCLRAYCLLTAMRLFTLYLIPLEPASTLIPLEDPFTGQFFYNNTVITKDLFFSGHISTMVLLTLCMPVKPMKYFFILLTVLAAILIIVQHVHYTIDILAAPLFAYISYKLAGSIPLAVKK